ncbi:hypothetical protein SESBI_42364 [Sesbania bispinosa]|nr:hypothetical protein SESBI_42364 [Sesbania bispinosa]
MDEDEVYSVARLLGDLVAYRASGTGHMELLAGLLINMLAVSGWYIDSKQCHPKGIL